MFSSGFFDAVVDVKDLNYNYNEQNMTTRLSTKKSRNHKRLGASSFHAEDEAHSSSDDDDNDTAAGAAAASGLGFKSTTSSSKSKKSKSKPMEASTKRPVGLLDKSAQKPAKKRSIDPRFNELCGELDAGAFRKSYGFIYDDHLQNDAAGIQKALKRTKSKTKKEELQEALNSVKLTMKEDAGRQKRRMDEQKAKQLLAGNAPGGGGGDAAARGEKKKFHVTKSKQREALLKVKYDRLKKEGHLDKWLEGKRRKVAAKERKRLPQSRP